MNNNLNIISSIFLYCSIIYISIYIYIKGLGIWANKMRLVHLPSRKKAVCLSFTIFSVWVRSDDISCVILFYFKKVKRRVVYLIMAYDAPFDWSNSAHRRRYWKIELCSFGSKNVFLTYFILKTFNKYS
jgi:hypothetical protein